MLKGLSNRIRGDGDGQRVDGRGVVGRELAHPQLALRLAHQQDQRISRIGASAGLAHQQDWRISRISASAG